MQKKTLGKRGESLARAFLEANHYTLLHQNWRLGRSGEIDLIVYHAKNRHLAFVEVKTRRSTAYGSALEAMQPTQQAKQKLLAEAFLAAELNLPDYQTLSFDLITVTPAPENLSSPTVIHYPQAF